MHADDPDEGQGEHEARHVGHDTVVGVDQVVAVDGAEDGERADQEDARGLAQSGQDEVQGLPADDQVRGEETEVHHDHDRHDEQ